MSGKVRLKSPFSFPRWIEVHEALVSRAFLFFHVGRHSCSSPPARSVSWRPRRSENRLCFGYSSACSYASSRSHPWCTRSCVRELHRRKQFHSDSDFFTMALFHEAISVEFHPRANNVKCSGTRRILRPERIRIPNKRQEQVPAR